MLWYVFPRLYRVCVWFVAIASNDVFYHFGGLKLFYSAVTCEFSDYACVISHGSVFIGATICVLRIAVYAGFVVHMLVQEVHLAQKGTIDFYQVCQFRHVI